MKTPISDGFITLYKTKQGDKTGSEGQNTFQRQNRRTKQCTEKQYRIRKTKQGTTQGQEDKTGSGDRAGSGDKAGGQNTKQGERLSGASACCPLFAVVGRCGVLGFRPELLVLVGARWCLLVPTASHAACCAACCCLLELLPPDCCLI